MHRLAASFKTRKLYDTDFAALWPTSVMKHKALLPDCTTEHTYRFVLKSIIILFEDIKAGGGRDLSTVYRYTKERYLIKP